MMHSADITAALKKAGYTQRRVAVDLAVSPEMVNMCIKGETSYRIAAYITSLVYKYIENPKIKKLSQKIDNGCPKAFHILLDIMWGDGKYTHNRYSQEVA